MNYNDLPADLSDKLSYGAGILLKAFDTTEHTYETSDVFAATTGGVNVTITPTWQDLGDGIDNCTKNIKELKRLQDIECKFSGSFKTVDTAVLKSIIAAADIDTTDTTNVKPRAEVKSDDFADLYYVTSYGDSGGICLKLKNALSTGGLNFQSANKDTGAFTIEYTGHTTLADPEDVPMDIFVW